MFECLKILTTFATNKSKKLILTDTLLIMKQSMFFKPFVAVMAIMLMSYFSSSAVAQSGDDVSYDEYPHMSTLKDANDGTLTLVIKNKKDLDRVFGPPGIIAPTPIIDFDKHFVIAVVLPKNLAQATIEPVSLKRKGNKLVFSYTIDPTKKVNYDYRNFTAILVDRSQPMRVDFQEVSSNGVALSGSNDIKALRNQVKYLTSENEELKKGVKGLNERIQELEAERIYYLNKIKEVQTENEQLKKGLRH